jgi:hypothetical protein
MNGQNVQLPANQPLTVTLEAQHWVTLMSLLRDVTAPHRITDPLIQMLSEQLQRQAPPPNGSDQPQPQA